MVEHTTTDALRRMQGKEGLVLQGCGGPLDEWVDGINEVLTEAGILKNGTTLRSRSESLPCGGWQPTTRLAAHG